MATAGAAVPPSTTSADATMAVERMDSSSAQSEEPPHRCVRSRGSDATVSLRGDEVNGSGKDKCHIAVQAMVAISGTPAPARVRRLR